MIPLSHSHHRRRHMNASNDTCSSDEAACMGMNCVSSFTLEGVSQILLSNIVALLVSSLASLAASQAPTTSSNLPGATGEININGSSLMNPPKRAVWNALRDFSFYPNWNPLVRSQIVANEFAIPLQNQTAFNYRVAWVLLSPEWILSTIRWSSVSTVVDDYGVEKLLYESRETFRGPLAGVVQDVIGDGIAELFQAQADALKVWMEG
ncbi:hypothetical protein IW261DRAFT_1512911 [Armillaria novae-zelandiae]|uniref:Uncharacterized protein n=1 Tax=Armillaria novae-zelandiae TaxID=153914 RepID=A0AA39NSZ8_9AGAR|nr:hypothetical protein IW261DRAFT_1512911 [Armillaria novae-zelandiae]